ncbi:Importin-5 [Trichoplax sp. H2]|nr:Importin-5 [Trichoplax sp. H2]|eukprot:RDD39148.1 Importin-5 [Trichoplax sp. H2]
MEYNKSFDDLLSNLMLADNDIRNAAEQQYSNFPFSTKLPMLIQSIRNSPNIENRQLAAVLFRKVLNDKNDEYRKLDESSQQYCKTELLTALQSEESDLVRRKVCDAVAELARLYVDDDNQNLWPEILQFLFQFANSPNLSHKEVALQIFRNFPTIFGNQQTHYLEVIKRMLFQCMSDTTNHKIAYLAVDATTAFLMVNDNDQLRRHFQDMVPPILTVVQMCLAKTDDDSPLKNLIEIAEAIPKIIRPHLNDLAVELIKNISNSQAESNYRQLSLEVLVTLAESAPAMMRKHGQIIIQLIPQCLSMMIDLEDDPEWSAWDNSDDPEDSDSNPIVAEFALDRLAMALGGKAILPHIVSVVPQMLQNGDWRYKYAGLMAISAVADGCQKQMMQLLTNVVMTILPFLKDEHPRVRYAACNAIGQMSTDFAEYFQKKFHDKVLPQLLDLMDDIANPRVQAHACAALYHFCDDCPSHILKIYLEPIAIKLKALLQSKLQELMQQGTKNVLEQAITAISTVAQRAEGNFLPYYDHFMPSLKFIIQSATTPEYRLLRGKTIECVSFIGLAVGTDKFLYDANDVMQLLLKTQTGDIEMTDDDPQVSYMMTAWARICKILGKQFVQYLPVVMPPLIKAASAKPEVAIFDEDDEKAQDDGWEFVKIGEQQKFGIKTAGLDDKGTACQMLVCYAKELKDGFVDYVEEVSSMTRVRGAAIESLPYLIESAKFKGGLVTQIWQFVLEEIFQAIKMEPEPEMLANILDSFAKCIESLGKGCVNGKDMEKLTEIIHEQIKKLQTNAQLRQEFLPVFDKLLPDFAGLITPDRNWQERQWAICAFDDLIEYTGNASFAYHGYFLEQYINSITDVHCEIRQSASYGCGIIAQFGGEEYSKFIPEFVPPLLKVITDASAKEIENLTATENAISAIVKICVYRSNLIDVNLILAQFLNWLPITEDELEAPHIYGFLCNLVESNNEIILGKDNCNLPRILSIFASAFITGILADDVNTKTRMETIVNQIKSVPEMWNSCLQHLPESDRQIFQ